MTIPIFDMKLEWRVLSMVMSGIRTTKELGEECTTSIEEIEELFNSKLFIPPPNREVSREGNPEHLESGYWSLSDTGRLFAEVEEIPTYPSPRNVNNYFDDKRFVPEWISKDIMNYVKLNTMLDNGDIYYYNGGVYKNGGEKIIAWFVRKLLGNMATKNRENETLAHISSITPIKREKFNTDLYKINLSNGIYCLDTKNFMPHTYHDMMTVQLPIEYDSNADCQKIKQFVSQIVDKKDVPIIQEMFGYCLLRDYRFHKIFMMLGEGSNGKSTLLELLKRFLGERNIASIALQEIDRNRFSISKLYGKLANIYADLSDVALKETGKMKMLCGGDTISAEKKFKDYFEFKNYAKLIFSANRLPGSFDDSDAFFRRWLIIQFPNQFVGDECNPKILRDLTSKNEMSGCFNWAVDGLNRLFENGCFSNERNVSDMRKLYRKLSSPIAAFAESMLEDDVGSHISKEEMYSQFVQFCKKEKLIPMTKPKFGKMFVLESGLLVQEGNTKIDGKNTRVWMNVKFKS